MGRPAHSQHSVPATPPTTDSDTAGRTSAHRVKIPHCTIVRAPGLLNMMYRGLEICEKLQVTPPTIQTWIKHSMPCQQDKRGHLWIIGSELADWVEVMRKPKAKRPMPDNQACCLTCRERVDWVDIVVEQGVGKQVRRRGVCPHCGHEIFRASSIQQHGVTGSNHDQS